ncbi:MAG: esterase-like activity of phytase family protein [Synechococcaceae cyanobacterium]|nr:esterase-like activity of phytase family protein [Synechococcaceae cyanobacterium]
MTPTGAAPPPPPPPLLPCPLAAGWEVIGRGTLPRRHADGAPAGGYSAAAWQAEGDELWLLSDAPRGRLAGWRGLGTWPQRPLAPLGSTPLRGAAGLPLPAAIDGEGLVLLEGSAWVASEGRRTPARTPQLLRFSRRDGRLAAALPLPPAWRTAPGRGLAANRGPESLALLRRAGRPPLLLLAAESPLLQDPPGGVRLLAWPVGNGPAPASGEPATELRPLALPVRGDWGLTDLLVVEEAGAAPALLGLWRSFEPPGRWQARLVLYPLPGPARAGEPPLPPRSGWNLLGLGVPADNWEAVAAGPPLADGRGTLVLVSDDNFSPLQENHLVRLAPRRAPGCRPLAAAATGATGAGAGAADS